MLFEVAGVYKNGERLLPPDRSPQFLRFLAAEMGHKLKYDFPVDARFMQLLTMFLHIKLYQ